MPKKLKNIINSTPSEVVGSSVKPNSINIDLSKGNMGIAWDFLMNSKESLMLTGFAGAGKSSMIKEFHRLSPKSVILATTGTAARLIKGQTIHSFFGINWAEMREPINPKIFAKKRKVFQSIDTIIIDESSLLKSDLLDIVDTRCQQLTGLPLPFGGIRMIFSFDLWQLPPVLAKTDGRTKEETSEYKVFKEMYDTPYFFGANVMQRLIATKQIKYIELTHCFRQDGDLKYANILNRIRKYEHTQEDLDWINSKCAFKENALKAPVTICTTNKAAQAINEVRLQLLSTQSKTYQSISSGKVSDKPIPHENKFKVGATILIKVNDQSTNSDGQKENRYQNGSIGIVKALGEDYIDVIVTHSQRQVRLSMFEWIDYEYEIDRENDTVIATPVGSYKSIPAIVAFAMTVHSTQGQTLDEAIFDVPAFEEFTHGLIYVALSRLTNTKSLALTKKLRVNHFKINTELKQFFEEIKPITITC